MNINERNTPLSLSLSFLRGFRLNVSKQQRVKRLARCEEANPDGFLNMGYPETTTTRNDKNSKLHSSFVFFPLLVFEREEDRGRWVVATIYIEYYEEYIIMAEK